MEETQLFIKDLVAERIAIVGEQTILNEIDERKLEYVDDDWDEQFDTLEEAYAEQGRGEAESEVCYEYAYEALGSDADQQQASAFVQEMMSQLNLSAN